MDFEIKRPSLTENIVKQKLHDIFEKNSNKEIKYVKTFFSELYGKFIKPNLSIIICILFILLLLYIRYIMIQNDRKNKGPDNLENILLDNIDYGSYNYDKNEIPLYNKQPQKNITVPRVNNYQTTTPVDFLMAPPRSTYNYLPNGFDNFGNNYQELYY
jgi:hypothetical protein